jgi:hypothetical protein
MSVSIGLTCLYAPCAQDYATHETGTKGYEKQWDKAGWQEPVYGNPSDEETKSGS